MAEAGPTENTNKWRYQAVTMADPDPICFLIEAYFDGDGKLIRWTDRIGECWAAGQDVEELSRDLVHMLAAAWKWKPVPFDDLRVGMTFEGTGVDVEDMIAAMDRSRKFGSTVSRDGGPA